LRSSAGLPAETESDENGLEVSHDTQISRFEAGLGKGADYQEDETGGKESTILEIDVEALTEKRDYVGDEAEHANDTGHDKRIQELVMRVADSPLVMERLAHVELSPEGFAKAEPRLLQSDIPEVLPERQTAGKIAQVVLI
jgi:hypothetical protein